MDKTLEEKVKEYERLREKRRRQPIKISLGEKLANNIVNKISTTKSVIYHTIFYSLYLYINTTPKLHHFDPYPYNLFTFIVSIEAIYLSLFILISQNKQAEQDRKHAKEDRIVNKKSEIEIQLLYEEVQKLIEQKRRKKWK